MLADLEVAAATEPIIDGTRERGEDPVVLLAHDSGGMCTGTVIAPRVVITAKHCVIDMYGTGDDLAVHGFRVMVGPDMFSLNDEYGVSEVRRTPGSDLYNSDFALLILSRDFEHGVKGWEFVEHPSFERNVTITAIGYGQTEFNNPMSAGTKYRRDGRVADIGPNAAWGIGPNEFISEGENTCQGDSGGPLLLDDVVVGIVSRGQEGCTGFGFVTRVVGFAAMIRQALEDTGACVPTSFEECNGVDDDCDGVVDNGLGEDCGCADGAVPTEELCDLIDNDCNGEVDDLEACACSDGGEPSEEVCDEVDNDCDGEFNEGCAQLGELCEAGDECSSGMCRELDGAQVCTASCVTGLEPCPEGGWCDGAPCNQGLCHPDRGGRADGERCSDNGECASGFCAAVAGGGTICARPCASGELQCYATEVCWPLEGLCGACSSPRGEVGETGFGEPCLEDDECVSGDCFVDGDEEECDEGCTRRYCSQPCGDEGECPAGAHCRGERCVRGPGSLLGETCVGDDDCLEGRCETYEGVSRCVEECNDGGRCYEERAECVEGFFCWPGGALVGAECDEVGEPCGDSELLCAAVDGEAYCVEPCESVADCVSGLSCVGVGDDGEGVCIPADVVVIEESDAAGGCSCSSPGADRRSPLALILIVGGIVALARRQRSSISNTP